MRHFKLLMLKVGLYRPQAVAERPAAFVSEVMAAFDIVALPGTQQRADPDTAITSHRTARHYVYSWGWKRGRFVNTICGVVTILGTKV